MSPIRKNEITEFKFESRDDMNRRINDIRMYGGQLYDEVLSDAVHLACDKELIEWLLQNGCKIEDMDYYDVLTDSASKVEDRLGIPSLLCKYGVPIPNPDDDAWAINHVFSLDWCNTETESRLKLVEELLSINYSVLTELTFEYALEYVENTYVFQWLIEKGCPTDGDNFNSAFGGANLVAIQWLLEKGFSWYNSDIEIFVSYLPGIFEHCPSKKLEKHAMKYLIISKQIVIPDYWSKEDFLVSMSESSKKTNIQVIWNNGWF